MIDIIAGFGIVWIWINYGRIKNRRERVDGMEEVVRACMDDGDGYNVEKQI